jgi:hypothetical protein
MAEIRLKNWLIAPRTARQKMAWLVGAFLFATSGLLTLLLASFSGPFATQASGPSSNRVLNYQIRLTDTSGVPVVDGIKNVKISFYDAASAGAWEINAAGKLSAKEAVAGQVSVKTTDQLKSIAQATIFVGSSAAVVENPAIRANSQIFVTFKKNPKSLWWIDETHDGSFILRTEQPVMEDTAFAYWIINVVDETTPRVPDPDLSPPGTVPEVDVNEPVEDVPAESPSVTVIEPETEAQE